MKRRLLPFCVASALILGAQAQDTLFVKEAQVPLLRERTDNTLYYLRIEPTQAKKLESITLQFSPNARLDHIKAVRIYYGGTEARQLYGQGRFAPVDYISVTNPLWVRKPVPSYVVLRSSVEKPQRTVTLKADQKLFDGVNYFWVSLELEKNASLDETFSLHLSDARADGKALPLSFKSRKGVPHRTGIGVRYAGDDGSAAFRIPGLTTTNKGTLLGVYDVRYNSSVDLQEMVDIGLSRSTDGGNTWEPMRIAMTMRGYEGLPDAQNGVGDPAILFDTKRNTAWVMALWTHGMGNQRAWFSSHKGMGPTKTGQLLLVKSTDDGKTWSQPINITAQLKRPDWNLILQGPGRGITMADGTLVFPIQYIDETAKREPHAGIVYSKDGGETWQMNNPARSNTTEAQVVEVEPGVLMLSMRDNRGGTRAVATTKDLGKTWEEHSSSRSALVDPVCMASLLSIKAKDNVLKKDILLFSNPAHSKHRTNITVKMSLDGGKTWKDEHQILLDDGYSWGYTCLTPIDKETIGILYESSAAQMTFQRIKLKDLMK